MIPIKLILLVIFLSTFLDAQVVSIKESNVSEDVEKDAIEIALNALDRYNNLSDAGKYIGKEFDKRYNPTWHCIIMGKWSSDYKGNTDYNRLNNYLLFVINNRTFLLFKSRKR